jgi:hypothetical protein
MDDPGVVTDQVKTILKPVDESGDAPSGTIDRDEGET